jgi:hypothetical protein
LDPLIKRQVPKSASPRPAGESGEQGGAGSAGVVRTLRYLRLGREGRSIQRRPGYLAELAPTRRVLAPKLAPDSEG